MTGLPERFLLDPEVNADPYPYLKTLREHRPVYWSAMHRAWLVTGYPQLIQCLREPAISADRVRSITEGAPEGESDDARRAFRILSHWMVFNNPPEHRRLRAVFQEQFAARAVGRYRALIERVTRSLLLRRAVHGTTGDVVADVAKPLPRLVFVRWLGVPQEHSPSFWFWNARVGDLVLGAAQEEHAYRTSLRSLLKLYDYLADLMRQRRAEPRDDLISAVLADGEIGSSVSEEEFVCMLTHLAFAGGETTSNLISNGLRALLLHPEQRRAVADDPGLVGGAVEETLRFDGPSKMSIRTAAADVDLDGATIRSGDRVFLVTAGANRDPAQFPDPDTFTVARGRSAHLGFGFGAHFCIGAPLARVVASAALGVLVRDHPDLGLVDQVPTWQLSLLNRSLDRLLVRY